MAELKITKGETRTYKSCGCRIFKDTEGKFDIDYCPLHKSAEELYEALKWIRKHRALPIDKAITVDKALAKAEGGE